MWMNGRNTIALAPPPSPELPDFLGFDAISSTPKAIRPNLATPWKSAVYQEVSCFDPCHRFGNPEDGYGRLNAWEQKSPGPWGPGLQSGACAPHSEKLETD